MDAVIALALLAAASGEPALAGGPDAPRVRQEYQAGYSREERVEHRRWASADGAGVARPAYGQLPAARGQVQRAPARHGAARAGDPLNLRADFFFAPQAGGVECPASVVVHARRGVIVIGPAQAPVSAGQAAAARGLPRG
jgi:hypothetical protein